MNILVVNWQDRRHPFAGGAEVHLHEVFGRLARDGHSIALLTSRWSDAPAFEILDGIAVHRVGGRFSFPLHLPRALRRLTREFRPDVIVDDVNKLPLGVWRLARRTPTLTLVHHLFGASAFRAAPFPVALAVWMAERILRILYPGIPFQAVSHGTARELVARGIPRDRITVIPNGVDTSAFRPFARAGGTPHRLVYVGRLQRYKRVELLVDAVAELRRRGREVRLDIVGDGAERRRVAAAIVRHGLTDHVAMHGFVEESAKRAFLAQADVHVIASRKEGWGLTVLEAAACGVPTVGTDAAGLRESILHDRTGLLVPGHDVRAFADAVARLLDDRALRDRLGADARRYAENLDWERTSARMLAHLRRVVEGTSTAREPHLVTRAAESPPLPSIGTPAMPYGARRFSAQCGDTMLTATLGATDMEGRFPFVEVVHPEGNTMVWHLLGWPEPPEAWITAALQRRYPGHRVAVAPIPHRTA